MAKISNEGYLNQLKDIKDKLADFLSQVENGKTSYIDDISNKLRILYCFKSGRKSLIKTICDLFDLEIKVYVPFSAAEEIKTNKIVTDGLTMQLTNSAATWFLGGYELIDLFLALERRDVFLDGEFHSIKHLIEVRADKLGGSHPIDSTVQDRDLAPHIENLLIGGLRIAEQVLYSTAKSSITLINLILHAIQNRKVNQFIQITNPDIETLNEPFNLDICRLEQQINACIQKYKIAFQQKDTNEYPYTSNELGIAFTQLSKLRDKEDNLKKSIDFYNEALKVYTKESEPLNYAGVKYNLGISYMDLGQLKSDVSTLNQSLNVHNQALEIYKESNDTKKAAFVYLGLGLTYIALLEIEKNTVTISKAIDNFKFALNILANDEQYESTLASIYNNLGFLYKDLFQQDKKTENADNAIKFFDNVLSIDKVNMINPDINVDKIKSEIESLKQNK